MAEQSGRPSRRNIARLHMVMMMMMTGKMNERSDDVKEAGSR